MRIFTLEKQKYRKHNTTQNKIYVKVNVDSHDNCADVAHLARIKSNKYFKLENKSNFENKQTNK